MRLTLTMIVDFMGCWLIEVICKYLLADLEPKAMVTRGRERRHRRRMEEVENRKQSETVVNGYGKHKE
jgi:cation-transporting ATPase 13A1